MRRGKPCTYKIYGVDIAVNAGNTMYYLPLLPLMEKKNGKLEPTPICGCVFVPLVGKFGYRE
jgi:hypothetical protein